MDLKNYFQLCQDLEIIRRVVFSQRHMVLSPLITLEAEKRAVDLLGKDKDLVQKLGTGIAKVIGNPETPRLDINENENEDAAPTCDRRDRIFAEQSSIGKMFRQKMIASGYESMKTLKKKQKNPQDIIGKPVQRPTNLDFQEEKIDFPVESVQGSHVTRPEGCDSDCKHRYNDCKALIDSLNRELSYEKGQRLKIEQRLSKVEKHTQPANPRKPNQWVLPDETPITTAKTNSIPIGHPRTPDESTLESGMIDLEAKVQHLLEIVDGRSPRMGSQTSPTHKIQTDSQEYTSLLYQQMERGLFPKQAELKTVITKSVHE